MFDFVFYRIIFPSDIIEFQQIKEKSMTPERTKILNFAADSETPESRIKEIVASIEQEEKNQKQMFSGFLSEKETMQFAAGASRSTIWSWRKKGLRSYKVNGRRLFDPGDIRDFIRKEGKDA